MHDKIPNGWRYNPSTWSERLPLAGLAAIGCLISVYLSLYQAGAIGAVWDPFFGNGSQRVLRSALSRWLPVPDAALGGAGYALEIVLAMIGGEERWRTKPWVSVGFGLLALAMGLVSLGLVICQPLLAHAWCTLCLCSAAISLVVVGPAINEMRAGWQTFKLRVRPISDRAVSGQERRTQ